MHRARVPLLTIVATVLAGTTLAWSASASPAAAPVTSYAVVSTANITAPAGAQTTGSATCAAGSKVTGGGVFNPNLSLGINLNSSYPAGKVKWTVRLNNTSPNAVSFRVYAVCVKPVKKYQIVSASSTNAAGTVAEASAMCPSGTVVLGGGTQGSLSSTQQNLNSSDLNGGNGWETYVNNGSNSNGTVTVYVVCGAAPTGYTDQNGFFVTNPAGQQTAAGNACPSGTKPLGGGAYSSSDSLAVNLGASYPTSVGWSATVDNASSSDAMMRTDVVCAQTP